MNRAPDRPNSKYKRVYPIARINVPFDQNHPSYSSWVVKVLISKIEAEAEMSRLNQLNAGKGYVYLYRESLDREERFRHGLLRTK